MFALVLLYFCLVATTYYTSTLINYVDRYKKNGGFETIADLNYKKVYVYDLSVYTTIADNY